MAAGTAVGLHSGLRVVRLLSTGTHSRLLLCADADNAALVLKATRIDADDTAAAERARREINLSGRVSSDFVVASHGWMVAGPEVCLAMTYLPGGDLGRLSSREGTLSAPWVRFYIGCAALGLEALHSLGIAHRDVKPENICIDADGYAKLVDLGFCVHMPPSGRSHTLLGTPEYLAPEVFLGRGHCMRSDLWALGATLYTLLLSAHPYGGDTPDLLYAEALRGPPHFPAVTGFPPVMPPAARALIEMLLQHEPEARPPAASVWDQPLFSDSVYGRGRADDAPLLRSEVNSRSVRPPFVPRLRSSFDTILHEPEVDSDSDAVSSDECSGATVEAVDESLPQGQLRSMTEC